MLLKCCLLQYRHYLSETCCIFYICLYVWVLVYLCLIYVIYFFIIIFITINYIISLRQKNVFFGHVCQKFSFRVLLSFCLIFCQFEPGVACKSVNWKCYNWKKRTLCLHLTFKTAKHLCPNLQKPLLPSKIPGCAPETSMPEYQHNTFTFLTASHSNSQYKTCIIWIGCIVVL